MFSVHSELNLDFAPDIFLVAFPELYYSIKRNFTEDESSPKNQIVLFYSAKIISNSLPVITSTVCLRSDTLANRQIHYRIDVLELLKILFLKSRAQSHYREVPHKINKFKIIFLEICP